MTKKEFQRIAAIISAEGCYGEKEHPVRLMTLHDLAHALADAFTAGGKPRVEFLAACELSAVPAKNVRSAV